MMGLSQIEGLFGGTSPEQLALCALAGLGIGFLSGLLGIGGGTMMVPVFRLLFGMSAHVASATSLFAIIPTSLSGVGAHLRQKTALPLLGISAGLGGALFSPIGVFLGSLSPSWLILSATACVIGYSSISMLLKARKPSSSPVVTLRKGQDVLAQGAPAAGNLTAGSDRKIAGSPARKLTNPKTMNATQQGSSPHMKMSCKQVLIAAGIGAAAGLMAGFVGVGGGFLMVPLFISVLKVDARRASGSSLVAMCILAIPGVIEQGMLGHIAYLPGILVSCGTVPGAYVGARFIKKIPERALKLFFGIFMMFLAILLVTRM